MFFKEFNYLVNAHIYSFQSSGSFANSIATSTTSALNSLSADANETTSSSPFDENDELARIAASCLTPSDFEDLTGNVMHSSIAELFAFDLFHQTMFNIGLAELRATLNFAPLRPWKHYNDTDPSEEELESAPSIEEYYDLKEPRNYESSLDSQFLIEKNVISAIAFLDKRYPSIRTIFRRRFEAILRSGPEMIDRKVIDRMIAEFEATWTRVDDSTQEMISFGQRSKCRKQKKPHVVITPW